MSGEGGIRIINTLKAKENIHFENVVQQFKNVVRDRKIWTEKRLNLAMFWSKHFGLQKILKQRRIYLII